MSLPPPAAAPVRRSGASVAAPCERRHGVPDTLWSELSEQLHVHAPSSRPGVSAALPPATRERCYSEFLLASTFSRVYKTV